MAVIHRDVQVIVNGVNLSDHAFAVSSESTANEVDVTTFGPSGYSKTDQGLKSATITVSIEQDFAAGETHATLQPIYDNNTTVPVELIPNGLTKSATNPGVQLPDAKLMSYTPLSGSVGERSVIEATFTNVGDQGLIYDETP